MPRHARRTARLAAAVVATFATSMPVRPARAADTFWSAPTSGRWLDPANWSTAAVPTSTAAVTISTPGTYTVTLDAATSVGPLTLNNPDATLLLEPAPSSSFGLDTGDVNIAAGTLSLHTNAGSVALFSPSTSSTINLTNAGRIDYTADANPYGGPTASLTYLRTVSNSGTIEVHDTPTDPASHPNTVLRFSADTFTNTGTLRTGAHSEIDLSVSNTFNQDAGSLDGTVNFSGYIFSFNGGTASSVLLSSFSYLKIGPAAGAGTFVVRGNGSNYLDGTPAANQTIYVSPGYRLYPGAAGTFTNAGHILVGTDPLLPANYAGYGTTLNLNTSVPFANTGTLDVNSPQAAPSTINANVTNTGTVHIASPRPNSASASTPTALNGNWTNSGSITVAANAYATLSTGSSFTQNAGGSLTIDAEPLTITSGHFYYNGGSVSGTVSLSDSTVHFAPGLTNATGTFTFPSRSLNPLAGDIPAGVTVAPTASLPSPIAVNLSPFTNNGTLTTLITKTGSANGNAYYRIAAAPTGTATDTLTNAGTITGTVNGVDHGASLRIAGTLTNTGTVKAYNLTSTTFNQNAGTLTVDSTCTALGGSFNYNGGTITGSPVLLYNAALYIAPNTNPASFTFETLDCSLHGSPAPGSALSLDNLSAVPFPVTVTADPFTNAGTLSFAATTVATTSTLTVTGSGALTNTGTLSVTQGTGGTRTLNANVTNTGTFSVGPGATLTLNGSLTTTTLPDLQGTLDIKSSPLHYTILGDPTAVAYILRAQLHLARLVSSSADVTHHLAYAIDPNDPATVNVTLALTGDVNLDGKVDADDFALLDRALARSLTNALWTDGDFDYDGAVTSSDYLLIDTAFATQQGGRLSPSFLAERESQFGADYVAQLLTGVPEPSSAAILVAGLLPLARRRRPR